MILQRKYQQYKCNVYFNKSFES